MISKELEALAGYRSSHFLVMARLRANFPRAVAAIVAVSLLSGCARNQLGIENAGMVQRATSAAATGAEAFLDRVDQVREETTIALVVADPACGQIAPEVRTQPDLRSDAPDLGALCVKTPRPDSARRLSTAALTPELEPTLRLAQALGAYGATLANAVEDREEEDPAAPLLDALTLAKAAQTTLAGAGSGPVPAQNDPRVKAAADLVNFVGGLIKEASTVKRLRAAIAEQPDIVPAIVDPLERQIQGWERARRGDAGLRLVAAGFVSSRVIERTPPASGADRRAALTSFYATRDALAAEARFAPAVLQALHAVRETDADLRRLLSPGGRLTKSERRRVARLNRERLVAAFTRVAALATAIRGA
ncbi:hypothetical protein [Sphingomonas mollis]|uniref:Imelysin-like domain-containing protein n=1 Tax=Sphingomonas mollis TaxID=2795726 RepID=A0ABS0XUD5_9SPHN|nr:hypothetical protein [Sphingomonas sp. BT553]MBJ6123638.1 hypothetical protein [Sphingomonas sp. BT553]